MDIGKTAKQYLVITLLGILCVLLLISALYLFFSRNLEHKETYSIKEEIVPVAKHTTNNYNFTQILFMDETCNPQDLKNPITGKRYISTVEGSAGVGINNIDAIDCKTDKDISGKLQRVNKTIHKSKVFDVSLTTTRSKSWLTTAY